MSPAGLVEVNGVSLHVVDEGTGPPVLLLHGFPDSSHLWRHQVPALVTAGFRVVAPDLRGFGRSDRPDRVEDYALPVVLADVVALLAHLELERVAVVGHDWGSAVGWAMAGLAPHLVTRLAGISVGHPGVRRHLGIEQRERSWYTLLFQFPEAEALLTADDWKLFREWTREDGDQDRYLEDLSRPGALTAGLNWYRANLHPRAQLAPLALPTVQVPVLGIWSSRDHYLVEDHVRLSARFVEGPWRYERVDGVSHWVPLEAPDHLNRLLIGFLSQE